MPFLPGVQCRGPGQEKGNFPHLETNATVGPSDDDQLAVQPLLAAVDPHRQLLPQPESEHHDGGVEGGRGAEGEEGVQHPEGMGKPVPSNSGWLEMLVWLVVLVATVANSGRLYSITSAFPLCRCGLGNSKQLGVGGICTTHRLLFCKIENVPKMGKSESAIPETFGTFNQSNAM